MCIRDRGDDVRSHTCEIGSGFIDVFLVDADGQIAFLVDTVVGTGDLGKYTEGRPAGEWVSSVSYTHLDVYKRQLLQTVYAKCVSQVMQPWPFSLAAV